MIGTGISGLGAAYALSKGHEVELFERDDRAGGHSNTVERMVAGRTRALDTSFIVHNEGGRPFYARPGRRTTTWCVRLNVRQQTGSKRLKRPAEECGLRISAAEKPYE